MTQDLGTTVVISGGKDNASATIKAVYDALNEKGYAAASQIVGYLISGDPSYITSYNDARNIIQNYERDELMEVFVDYYLKNACK